MLIHIYEMRIWVAHKGILSPYLKNSAYPGIAVLVLRCAACKSKLWKYDKIGPGEVLRCHKARIIKKYAFTAGNHKIQCTCGKDIGIDKGTFIKMIGKAFTYSGTKRNP